MAKFKEPVKITLQMEFDDSEAFSNFCKMLMDSGYEHVVRSLGEAILEEARKRDLPVVDEIEKALAASRA